MIDIKIEQDYRVLLRLFKTDEFKSNLSLSNKRE